MHTWFQRRHTHPSSTLLGVLLALSVVWIGALHYSPAAHDHAHHDAHEEDHHCVVEVFADGVISEVAELRVALATETVVAEISPRHEVWLEETKHLRPQGRAPPSG